MLKINIKDIITITEQKIIEKYDYCLIPIKETLFKFFNNCEKILHDINYITKDINKNDKIYLLSNNPINLVINLFEISPKYYFLDSLNTFIKSSFIIIQELKLCIHPLYHCDKILKYNKSINKIEKIIDSLVLLIKKINEKIEDNEPILMYINNLLKKINYITKYFTKESTYYDQCINFDEYYLLFNESMVQIKNEINNIKNKELILKMIYYKKIHILTKIELELFIKELLIFNDSYNFNQIQDEISISSEDFENFIDNFKLISSTEFLEDTVYTLKENTLIAFLKSIDTINKELTKFGDYLKFNFDRNIFFEKLLILRESNKKINLLLEDENYYTISMLRDDNNFNYLSRFLDKISDYQKKIVKINNLNNYSNYLREEIQKIYYNEFQLRVVIEI